MFDEKGIVMRNSRSLSLCPPPISLVTHCPPREKEYLRLISIHLLLAHLMLFCQSIDLVITIDTF